MALYINDKEVYSGTFGAGMYISVDEGDTWEPCDSPLGTISDIMGLDDGTMLVAYLGAGVHVVSSECSNYYLDTLGMSNRYVTSLTTDGEHIYAGTYQGIYARSIHDNTWHSADLPVGAYSSHIHSILSTPFGLIAGGSGVVFYQLRYESKWQTVKLDKATDIVSLAWLDQQLVIGTSGRGAYLFSIPDSVWTNPTLATGLPLKGIVTLIRRDGNNKLTNLSTTQGLSSGETVEASTQQYGYPRDYVHRGALEFIAFHETGVFRRGKTPDPLKMGELPQPALLSSSGTGSTDELTALVKVYPTIVIDELTVELSEAETGSVPIVLFDESGRMVGQSRIVPGSLQYHFEALHLPAGMYWCQVGLSSGKYIQSFVVGQ